MFSTFKELHYLQIDLQTALFSITLYTASLSHLLEILLQDLTKYTYFIWWTTLCLCSVTVTTLKRCPHLLALSLSLLFNGYYQSHRSEVSDLCYCCLLSTLLFISAFFVLFLTKHCSIPSWPPEGSIELQRYLSELCLYCPATFTD